MAAVIPARVRHLFGIWRPEYDMPDQTGRAFIVTGANSGIGFYMAKQLAYKGATVVMACRSLANARKAMKDIKRDVPHARLTFMELDLASFQSIRQFVSAFKASGMPLHGLINNGGEGLPPPRHTEQGYMWNMGVNYFGPFFLTHLMLDKLKEQAQQGGEPTRIVNVCSYMGELIGTIDWDDIRGDKLTENDAWVYARAKLMWSMSTRELSRRLEGTGISVFAAHPGYAATQLFRKSDRKYFATNLFLSTEELPLACQHTYYASMSALFALTDPSLKRKSGLYIGPNRLNWFNTHIGNYWIYTARDMNKCAIIYDETVKILAAELTKGPEAHEPAGAGSSSINL